MVESVIVLIGNFLLPYLALSLLAMLVVELLAGLFELRGRTLRRFVRRMLADPEGTGLAGELYAHHLVGSLAVPGRVPSYIPAELFAVVLADVLRTRGDGAFARGVALLPSPELRRALGAILDYAAPGRELGALRHWYDQVMDGASGAYRLRTLGLVMLVACAMVLPTNFDAIRISDHVARRDLVEKVLAARLEADSAGRRLDPSTSTPTELAALQQLAFPIGWQGEGAALRARRAAEPGGLLDWLLVKVVGLLTSILAIMLGAPFLFDLLNRFMVVRSTVKPWRNDAAADPDAPTAPTARAVPTVPAAPADG